MATKTTQETREQQKLEKNLTKKKRPLWLRIIGWLLTVIIGLVLILILVILIIYACKPLIYSTYIDSYREEVSIPSLEDKYTPQGMCYDDEEGVYYFSGYMTDDTPSRLHVVDKESNSYYVNMAYPDGSDFYGHVGGISEFNDFLYIANEESVYIASKPEVLAAENGDSVPFLAEIEIGNNASFSFTDGKNLYLGAFYREGNYETDEDNYVDTTDGDTNKALCSVFTLDADSEYGVKDFDDFYLLSLPKMIQGLAVSESGKIILSESYAIASSHLYIHNDLASFPSSNIISHTLDGKERTCYILDSNTLEEDISMPPMSEDLDYYDGRVYINWESDGAKYRMVNIFRESNVTSYPVE